ncbi:MAG TPA: pyrroline-5-carboxylate reductase [Caldimonas sp.]|jgi:pyrroline-5-carboxylate reductase|nr:pyrroline-5-carboxylate reductase [Caldimonas sp.]HEX2540695.1 pyrroline-5-carboxylate reductase [Caldimonas sp.]
MATTAFIGGGNMASALVGGLLASGQAPAAIRIVEPDAGQRRALRDKFGVEPQAAADASLADADVVVWAVKPQLFRDAAAPCAPHIGRALQLSVMAGVRSDAIAAAAGSERVVRAMPNTPSLIGQGIAGLYARSAVADADRRTVEGLLRPTGAVVWFEREEALDAVTALSASGPAYVFYLLEAMTEAGVRMGLSADDSRRLAVQTVAGAAALAAASAEPIETLRRNVTSRGGTTHAAISELEDRGVGAAFVTAIEAARRRARELGDEFGRP